VIEPGDVLPADHHPAADPALADEVVEVSETLTGGAIWDLQTPPTCRLMSVS
jgi:hypothetical protein